MARRRARRDGDPRQHAVDGRHFDGAAQRRRGHGDRHPAMDVGALALENPVRLDREKNIKIASSRTP